jgi:NAD(P)H-flavin reductase
MDDQVKIRGFRVELDGVSRSIEEHPAVIKACALKIDEQLWGFYSAPSKIDECELRESAGNGQPFYAVPTVWVHLSAIKLTANGKVDKKVLREIAEREAEKRTLAGTHALVEPGGSVVDIEQSSQSSQRVPGDSDSGLSSDGKADTGEQYALPPKRGFHGWRWVRHRVLSAYRKLFGLIFLGNLAAFLVMVWRSRGDGFALPLPDLATAVAANLLGAVLLRQDYVVNFIFWLATRLPTSAPLWIRRHFARVYHNGGVHSGCAVSASVWWAIFTGVATADFASSGSRYSVNKVTITLTYLILMLLVSILVMAYPTIRATMHDQFEWTHRFAGWLALALVWAHVVAVTASLSSSEPLGAALAKTPAVYLVALTTLSIALPWMRLRRVKVTPEPLSSHAVRLHFDFCTPRPCTSLGVRITDRPMVEWHAFAAIPSASGRGFSIIVSRAGDWTKRIIERPPTSIWTRGTPASGVLAIAPLFKKIVLVATGSGIGPCLPVIMERRVPCRIVWSTKNPARTYGQKIIDAVQETDPDAVIWDTDSQGRPNLVALAYQIYRESGAECVCVISNSSTTAKTVYELESRGVPAFGPIWDS